MISILEVMRAFTLPNPVATGGFDGLSPPKQTSKFPNWNMKHYKSVSLCQILECQAPQLKTFWRGFWPYPIASR